MARPSNGSTQVTTTKPGALAPIDFGDDVGKGFEGAGREAYAIPFLAILQSNSPQCKKSEGAYIKGAEEGMFFNTVANEVYSGEEGILVIPAAFQQTYVEWGTREKGGGFIQEHDYLAGGSLIKNTRRDDKNRNILSNGHQLNDTRNHYLLYQDSDGHWQPILMSLTSTGIKFSRNWMTTMQRLAQNHRAPMYGLVFRMTTEAHSNDKGSWFGPHVEFVKLVDDAGAYAAAKAFNKQVAEGLVRSSPREADDDPRGGASSETNPDDI